MIKIYGIKNCDTMKKAMRKLELLDIEYELHDYKKQGLTKARLEQWCREVDWELLLNRRGTTWRKLPESSRANIKKSTAIALMLEHTSMIKRPIVEAPSGLQVGFDETKFDALVVK